jgi:uncharacterized surface protein with fasciclin (FAS1) repeats
MSRRSLLISVCLAAAALATASCSSSSSSSSSTTAASAASTSSSAATSASPTATGTQAAGGSELFGSGCQSLGVSAGTATQAASSPVGTVAAGLPGLSNVVTAATVAGMVQTLNQAPALTVFAPSNAAFAKEPPGLVKSLLTDPSKKPQLVATLKYHVIAGQLPPAKLAGRHPTLNGASLTVSGSGQDFTVNGKAHVVCGGLLTKNAIVYIIDAVLHPAG